ncbi:hypothetical protein ASD68_01330 [Rhodanobacter sp. Root627]|uniref:hypothetical protein n=1 Tax=Rhodanobacter sp. Root627 TaxID=1736572 RepID=UPI0006F63353|nr:hypothetical protein [Rhodanobacter sp. Root627]KRA35122.1 hypothetical protein ASD68_01330 [Rhodanobacter sp. Root627]
MWLALFFLTTTAVYWSGLSGGFLFDDYPNIVENRGVQPPDASLPSLVRAALSSPSSEFKRPLASLSFAANYLATGLDPYWMKLTNLIIHLLNGLLVFLLARALVVVGSKSIAAEAAPITAVGRAGVTAALIAGAWMLLPINLTAVVYVVQRMESMANLFVLLGLIGYMAGRQRMLAARTGKGAGTGLLLCVSSLILGTVFGLLAKETAVMLPLYAFLVEWIVLNFRAPPAMAATSEAGGTHPTRRNKPDYRVIGLFVVVLLLPLIVGLVWLLPGLFHPNQWSTRDFTMSTRLLSEARIVADYVVWTLFPTPGALSFYHDDFSVSTGLLTPWTTLAGMLFLAGMAALMFWMRKRRPLTALGIALFLGCHLLTGTVLPLELIYEHRNYFASFGLMLAIIPYLAAPPRPPVGATSVATAHDEHPGQSQPFALPRYTLLAGLLLSWAALTALTAHAWGNPLRLAEDLAARAPQSPRAQYELGRTYIIYSHYQPDSPFTRLAYAPLEKSAALPNSSILPEQALIFMNARMHLPLKDAWWDSMITKLKATQPGVQDESSLGALTQCAREKNCDLPPDRMTEAFIAALSHPNPRPRLLATYGDYAWNVLDDHALGERMAEEAVRAKPDEPAYRITLVRMLAAQGRKADAEKALKPLEAMNIGGRLDGSLSELRALLDLR